MAEETNWAQLLPETGELTTNVQNLTAEVQALVAGELAVESVMVGREPKRDGLVVLRGKLLRPSDELFSRWLTALNQRGYTPVLQPDEGSPEQVILRVLPGVASKRTPNPWINLVLFVLTVLSTLYAGMFMGGTTLQLNGYIDLIRPSNLIQGWPFALTLLAILTAHEFGHYFAARYHKVAVTLPFFLPMPLTFGTLGAFIQLREPVPDRRKLFDIGVAGPLAGLILTVPLLFYGLSTSPLDILKPAPGAMLEGNSIFYYAAKFLVFGQGLPNFATGVDVFMNQVTFAAWIGLLVTALNLLPVGQLDGGHTVFALFGKRARTINRAVLGVMAVLGVLGIPPLPQMFPFLQSIGYNGWLLWLGLIFFLIGPFHPPALDDVTQLDTRRRWIGYAVVVIFILIFVPVPMRPL